MGYQKMIINGKIVQGDERITRDRRSLNKQERINVDNKYGDMATMHVKL